VPDFAEPILHVDMDAFFVEVERRSRPELRGVPVIVGGLGNRGVVASASYEARRFGIHSAMPVVHARRLCRTLHCVPSDHGRYHEASTAVFEILREFTPEVEAVSVDEAFLDVSGLRLHYPDSATVADAIRATIRSREGLPASVGIASNKLLAKLASQAAKPDGIRRVASGDEVEFLHPLPVRALWGVGEATHASLERLGVATVGDLAALPRDALVRTLGRVAGAHLWELARGIDERPVATGGEAKSVSVEETFEQDLSDAVEIEQHLFELCERLSARLRRARLAGRTVTIKVRSADFVTATRSHTLHAPVDVTAALWDTARALWGKVGERGPIRLLGVGVAALQSAEEARQLPLTGVPAPEVIEVTDRIKERFGDDAVRPARTVRRRPPPGSERG
jgi:DNA polymerase-4